MIWQEQIRDAIDKRGWTQAETAKRIGISPSYLSDVINSRRHLSARVAVRLELVLNVVAWKLLYLQMADEMAAIYADITLPPEMPI